MDPEDYEKIRPLIARAVDSATSEYGKFSPREDFEAHCWLIVFENRDAFSQALTREDDKSIIGHLTAEAMRFGLAEKAVQHGYSIEDMIEYPPAMIRHLLPDVFDLENVQSFESKWDAMPRSKGLANATGDKLAHVLDIRSALPRLTQKQYDAIVWRYKMGYSFQLIGQELGISEEAAKDRVRKAIRSLSKTLRRGAGGSTPEGRSTSRREVHSNATWRSKTDSSC